MKIAIIEDEINAYEYLVRIVAKVDPNIEIVQHCESIKSSVNYFQSNPEVDLVLMDIQLADGISFEIFNHTKIEVPIVFITAYDAYAIEAFKVNSIDYLLKPIDADDLKRSLEKYHKLFDADRTSNISSLIDSIRKDGTPKKKNRFLVKKGSHFEYIDVKDVALVMSEDSITFLFSTDGMRHIYSKTLENLMDELPEDYFFQISRNAIVHIHAVHEIHPFHNQRLVVKLKNKLERDLQLIVSRGRVTGFKNWVDQ